jgi:hypothetical protein
LNKVVYLVILAGFDTVCYDVLLLKEEISHLKLKQSRDRKICPAAGSSRTFVRQRIKRRRVEEEYKAHRFRLPISKTRAASKWSTIQRPVCPQFCTKSSKLTPSAPSSTSDKTSFAYISARDRWPVILVRNTQQTTDEADEKDWSN